MGRPEKNTREEDFTSDGQTEPEEPFKRPKNKKQKKKGEDVSRQLDTDMDAPSSQEVKTGVLTSSSPGGKGAAQNQSEAQNEPILNKIAKQDKIINRALVNLSAITGRNDEAMLEIDSILTAISKMKTIALEADQRNHYLRGKLETTEERLKCCSRPSYAAVAAEAPKDETQQAQESRAIVITAKDRGPEEIIHLIKKTVDPVELGIRHTSMRPGRAGVVVTSTDKNSLERLAAHVQGADELVGIEVRQPRGRTFDFKVVGIEQEAAEELANKLIQQNALACTESDLQVKTKYQGRYGITAIITVNGRGYEALRHRSHVNVGWTRCPLYDGIRVMRCTRCPSFTHRTFECTKPGRCAQCSEQGHETGQCRRRPMCLLCRNEGVAEAHWGHSMLSPRCPSYQKKVEDEKQKIISRLN